MLATITTAIAPVSGKQIEQLVIRTNQLKAQVEELNTGTAFDGLCDVQTCESLNCANTGTTCSNQGATGNPVGCSDDVSCCGQDNPANLSDIVDNLSNRVRLVEKELARQAKLICEIRASALKTVLLNAAGEAKGGLALNGNLKSFQAGSWELATT